MGNRIKMLRESRGMTQSDLAAALGIRQNTLSTWETGRYEPDNDRLREIAAYFGVSVDYVIGGDPAWTNMPGDQIDMMRMVRLVRLVEQMTVEQFDELLEHCQSVLSGAAGDLKTPTNADALLLAYAAAPAEIRTIVDTALAPYRKDSTASETA